ncbi:MAG: ABC transporter substrate-binding protein [Agathobaculum sp.]|jgi:branched-chain amino acid transport system substrate-binding protein|uniref:ABC transporter substrate-binding protein n=1 Tax=Agathobaculum sp. TaxID=2048138 RepID=UPI003D8D7C4F
MKKMKRLLSLGLSLAMVMSLAACGGNKDGGDAAGGQDAANPDAGAAASGDVIKMGSLWPLTGGSATIGQHHADGAEMAIKEINANGGVKSMDGAQIELVVADTESAADKASVACERLITDSKVNMIIGAYNSTSCIAATEVSQKYKIPFLSQGGVATAVTERGYDYVFRINNTATYDVIEMITALDTICEEQGLDTLSYALVYENSDWGADNARIWKEAAAERGWTCVLDEPVTNGQADMTAQVLKVKESGADVLNVSFYTDDAIVFSNALYANQVDLPYGVWSVGGGWQDSAYREAVGEDVYNYHFVQEDWDMSGVQNYDWIKEVAEQCEAEYGYKMDSFFAQGWTAAYVAYYALEAAGSTEPEAIRDAIAGLELHNDGTDRAFLSGYSAVVFDEKGQNTFDGGPTGGTIIQYQDGAQVALYPKEHSVEGNKAILPIPAFSER